jgi:hypothetical protein
MKHRTSLLVCGTLFPLSAQALSAATPWSVRVRAMIRSDVYAGSTRLTTAQLDPWLYAVGLRYDF